MTSFSIICTYSSQFIQQIYSLLQIRPTSGHVTFPNSKYFIFRIKMKFLLFGFVIAIAAGINSQISSITTGSRLLVTGSLILFAESGVEAKKSNPWKKTVGKATKKKSFFTQMIEDTKKKSMATYSWIIKKIKKSEFTAQNVIATQIFAAGAVFYKCTDLETV